MNDINIKLLKLIGAVIVYLVSLMLMIICLNVFGNIALLFGISGLISLCSIPHFHKDLIKEIYNLKK